MSGVTTEQLDEWERLANEAERGRRRNASTSEMLAVIEFDDVSRLAVPQLVAEVRRLRQIEERYDWCKRHAYRVAGTYGDGTHQNFSLGTLAAPSFDEAVESGLMAERADAKCG